MFIIYLAEARCGTAFFTFYRIALSRRPRTVFLKLSGLRQAHCQRTIDDLLNGETPPQ
jgi:hypothetical protein